MQERKALTGVPIHDLLASRWSPRAFAAGKTVSRAQVTALLEAGRWAPSCNGDEPWRYLVWDKSRDAQGWQQAFDCLSENNQKWVKNVPLLMLSCAGSIFGHNGKPNRWTQQIPARLRCRLCCRRQRWGWPGTRWAVSTPRRRARHSAYPPSTRRCP